MITPLGNIVRQVPDTAAPSVLDVHIASLLKSRTHALLTNIDFQVRSGECLAIIGPNGSGKSSLLRAINQELALTRGRIALNGQSITTLSRQTRARQIAVLSQNDLPDLRLTLEDYVMLGRIPHVRAQSRAQHRTIVTEAIRDTGLSALRHRTLSALSGGERQRAALARALAQTPDVLLLDEPTNHLDPLARAELLTLVKSKGITVLAVLHDLALLEPFADRVLMLAAGRQIAWDTPATVLTNDYLRPVFGLTCIVVPHPETGKTLRIFEVPERT